jgi:hypothetical protein
MENYDSEMNDEFDVLVITKNEFERLNNFENNTKILNCKISQCENNIKMLNDKEIDYIKTIEILNEKISQRDNDNDILNNKILEHIQTANILNQKIFSNIQQINLLNDTILQNNKTNNVLNEKILKLEYESQLYKNKWEKQREILKKEKIILDKRYNFFLEKIEKKNNYINYLENKCGEQLDQNSNSFCNNVISNCKKFFMCCIDGEYFFNTNKQN